MALPGCRWTAAGGPSVDGSWAGLPSAALSKLCGPGSAPPGAALSQLSCQGSTLGNQASQVSCLSCLLSLAAITSSQRLLWFRLGLRESGDAGLGCGPRSPADASPASGHQVLIATISSIISWPGVRPCRTRHQHAWAWPPCNGPQHCSCQVHRHQCAYQKQAEKRSKLQCRTPALPLRTCLMRRALMIEDLPTPDGPATTEMRCVKLAASSVRPVPDATLTGVTS